jgi:hypothetical protein
VTDPIISKEALLKGQLPEGTVDIPDVGTVRVRGLSRAEVLSLAALDAEAREVKILACGVVEPVLTEEEIRGWREAVTSRTIRDVSDEIMVLSGLVEKAREDAKRQFQKEQRS